MRTFRNRFNAGGRAYLDAAAMAGGYQVATSGHTKSVFGTSASAPVFASVIAKINDARLQAGKGPV
jgi:tripeptidyl-peptidase-1